MQNIAIFASYNGSGFDAIYGAIKEKKLNLNIVFVLSNNIQAKALQKAKEYGITHYLINAKTDSNPDYMIMELLKQYNCKYIFLSGYMKKVSPAICNNFKVINSHPALLPKYGGKGMYGKFVHEAVIANKEKISGVTIHEVNEFYDEGKILYQESLTLNDNESALSLEEKIKALEQTAIVHGLQRCLN